MSKRIWIAVMFVYTGLSIQAQIAEMSLSQAVEIALKSNYDVHVARNNLKAAGLLASRAQAGYLPSILLNAGGSYSNNSTNIEFAGGALPPVERSGVENTAISSGLALNYVLFNGFGRAYSYKSLMAAETLSEVQARVLTENLVMEVIDRFLNIQQMQLNLLAAQQNLIQSRDRLKRARIGAENGVKTSVDVLSAEVDKQQDSLQILQWINQIEKEKGALNVLMGRDPAIPFFISSEQPVPAQKSINEWRKLALANNAAIELSRVMLQMSAYDERIQASRMMPQLSMSSGYGLNSSQNGAGIIVSQRTLGFNAGLNLSIPLFNGFQLKNALRNAELNVQNREFELEQAVLLMEQQLFNAGLDEFYLEAALGVQNQAIELSEQGLKRAQLAYQQGQIGYTDLRAAQISLLQAQNMRNEASINLVKLYFQLSRLGGELLN